MPAASIFNALDCSGVQECMRHLPADPCVSQTRRGFSQSLECVWSPRSIPCSAAVQPCLPGPLTYPSTPDAHIPRFHLRQEHMEARIRTLEANLDAKVVTVVNRASVEEVGTRTVALGQ